MPTVLMVASGAGSGTSAENHASLLPYIETHMIRRRIGYETPLGGAITAIFDRLSAEADGYASGDVKILGSVPAQEVKP
jgi:translation elongation factor EF-4